MSGTSVDGVDAALIETDGERVAAFGPTLTVPYPDEARRIIRAAFGATAETEATRAAEQVVTKLMGKGEAAARRELMELHGDAIEVDI